MSADDHRAVRADLGAHALGQLSPDDARRVEEHLAGCATCRAEHDELLPAAGALRDLRGSLRGTGRPGQDAGDREATRVDQPPHLEERVTAGVRAAARADRRRQVLRSAALLGVGAAAASAVLAATVGLDGDERSPAVPLEAVEVQVEEAGVEADADLVAHTWGVEVKLTATGFRPGGRYRVVVLGQDGRTYAAGGFVGTGAAEMHCNLNSTVLRERASGFEIRDDEGQVVVTSAFDA